MTRRLSIRRGDVFHGRLYVPPRAEDERTTHPRSANRPGQRQRPLPSGIGSRITTQKADRIYEQDVFLPAGEANLKQDSKVMLGLTQPFAKRHLGRRVGRMSDARMRLVEAKLLRLFGFISP